MEGRGKRRGEGMAGNGRAGGEEVRERRQGKGRRGEGQGKGAKRRKRGGEGEDSHLPKSHIEI